MKTPNQLPSLSRSLRFFRSCRAQKAFTLVEVTMAMGIVATVMVPLLALLPYSMNTMREAIDTTTASRILQQIASDVQMTNYAQIDRLNSRLRYYNDQGTDITDSGGKGSIGHVYTAKVTIPRGSNTKVQLPGALNNGLNKNVRKIIVEVATTRGLDFNFNDPENASEIQRFTTFISRLKDDVSAAVFTP